VRQILRVRLPVVHGSSQPGAIPTATGNVSLEQQLALNAGLRVLPSQSSRAFFPACVAARKYDSCLLRPPLGQPPRSHPPIGWNALNVGGRKSPAASRLDRRHVVLELGSWDGAVTLTRPAGSGPTDFPRAAVVLKTFFRATAHRGRPGLPSATPSDDHLRHQPEGPVWGRTPIKPQRNLSPDTVTSSRPGRTRLRHDPLPRHRPRATAQTTQAVITSKPGKTYFFPDGGALRRPTPGGVAQPHSLNGQ